MKTLKKIFNRISPGHGQSGFTLLEGLVSIGLLGGVLLTMIFAMGGGVMTVGENAEDVTAQKIARSQMEYVKSIAYVSGATSYPSISVPADYTVTVAVASVPSTNANIQKVTATIKRNGVQVMTITDYKENR